MYIWHIQESSDMCRHFVLLVYDIFSLLNKSVKPPKNKKLVIFSAVLNKSYIIKAQKNSLELYRNPDPAPFLLSVPLDSH